MKFFASVSALAAAASAASVNTVRSESPLDIKLTSVGNNAVKATITNNDSSDLRIFKTGTMLDTARVEKVKVYQGKKQVGFAGVRQRTTTTGLKDSAFQTIKAGESFTTEINVAELHDLSEGGSFDIHSKGALQYATEHSNIIKGSVPFSSNVLSLKVDGKEAAKALSKIQVKRSAVQDDCSGSELSATTAAIEGANSLANAAAEAASSDDARLEEYFGSTSVRDQVVSVFEKVADEASSTSSGAAQYCTDVYDACSDGVLAYTLPSQDFMVNCPIYFSYLSAASSTCHDQDQQSTTLHEMTHLSEIAGTDDLGYGYSAATALSTEDALNNADSYALFAQAVYADC
ncbi:neutral protease 2-like protein [Xylariaceae sp. FL1019]|nr:neutral protease 2-like protein [Xylariaceae sp. FL1019]